MDDKFLFLDVDTGVDSFVVSAAVADLDEDAPTQNIKSAFSMDHIHAALGSWLTNSTSTAGKSYLLEAMASVQKDLCEEARNSFETAIAVSFRGETVLHAERVVLYTVNGPRMSFDVLDPDRVRVNGNKLLLEEFMIVQDKPCTRVQETAWFKSVLNPSAMKKVVSEARKSGMTQALRTCSGQRVFFAERKDFPGDQS